MKTIVKFLAPTAIALFAFGAQAAETISTGGETYKGHTVVMASSSSAPMKQVTGRVSTGGELYAGSFEQPKIFVSPTRKAGFDARELKRLYLG